MRIIAGRFRSRKLLTPRDKETTRPIPDRVKESVFSLLRGNIEGASFLDCFAGTGAIGLEALSRGASRVVFVERDRRAAEMLERNIEMLEIGDECEVVRSDALGPAAIARCPKPVDLVFFDPPYPLVLDPEGWPRVKRQFERVVGMLSDTGFALLRTPWPFRHVKVIDMQGNLVPHGDPRNPFNVKGKVRKDMPPPSGKKFKGKRGKIGGEMAEDIQKDEWIGDDIDLEAIERETQEAIEAYEAVRDRDPASAFKILREDIDLSMEGAVGPETHVYASQAVHFYMRKR